MVIDNIGTNCMTWRERWTSRDKRRTSKHKEERISWKKASEREDLQWDKCNFEQG